MSTINCKIEGLLFNDFADHHRLEPTDKKATTISQSTNDEHFEIEDDEETKELLVIEKDGTAKYDNPNRRLVYIVNYDKFITSFKHKEGSVTAKKRCDAIVYTDDEQYFLLNELKQREIAKKGRKKEVRKKAIAQLKDSLTALFAVNTIQEYIRPFRVKRCCYFNKKVAPPSPSITALTAFNRLNTLCNGLQLPEPDIEGFGFEFWEYTGEHTFQFSVPLQKKKTSLEEIAKNLSTLRPSEAIQLSKIIEFNHNIKP